MRESSTYQAILAEGEARGLAEGEARGRAAEARRILLRLGHKRFGPPDTRTRAALERIADPDQIERMTDRVLDGASWDDLEIPAR